MAFFVMHRTKVAQVTLTFWIIKICATTLGTALGDFLADDSGLGFLGGAVLIGGIIVLIALAYYLTRLTRVMLFWFAFVLTRPFDATFGDLLNKPLEKGGLDFGTIGSSATCHCAYRLCRLHHHCRKV